MDHPPEIAALIEKYPTLRKPFETGIESHDGREQALLTYITTHQPSFANNPPEILAAIDHFSLTQDFMISIGAHKASVLSSLLAQQKPKVLVELGGYLGYSAILFASTMYRLQVLDFHVWSLEFNANFAAISKQIIELAGLSEHITVVVGPAEEGLRKLKEEKIVESVDWLFIDHVEKLYVSDFKVAIELGLLKKGAVVVADNVIKPGAPEYRNLVRGMEGLSSTGIRGLIQPGDGEDEFEISYVVKDLVGGQ